MQLVADRGRPRASRPPSRGSRRTGAHDPHDRALGQAEVVAVQCPGEDPVVARGEALDHRLDRRAGGPRVRVGRPAARWRTPTAAGRAGRHPAGRQARWRRPPSAPRTRRCRAPPRRSRRGRGRPPGHGGRPAAPSPRARRRSRRRSPPSHRASRPRSPARSYRSCLLDLTSPSACTRAHPPGRDGRPGPRGPFSGGSRPPPGPGSTAPSAVARPRGTGRRRGRRA